MKKIKVKIGKYLETNENGNITFQNLQDAIKAVLRGKFIEIHTYLKIQEKISNKQLNLPSKEIRKRKIKPKVCRRMGIKTIKEEINKLQSKKLTIEKTNKPKNIFKR